MKYILTIICVCFLSNIALVNSSYGYDFGSSNKVTVEQGSIVSPLIDIYNELINSAKSNISKVMTKLQKPVTQLMSSFMMIWLIVMATRSIMTGASVRDAVMSKLGLFITLSVLLQYQYFSTYVIDNLNNLFTSLPTYITAIGGGSGNLLQNIVTTSSNTMSTILAIMSDSSFSLSYILVIIFGLFACASVFVLTVKVMYTALVASIKFYLILSLSSIFILMFFFKATRTMSMQAINIVIECICQMCLLVAVLGLTSTVFIKLLSGVVNGTSDNIIASCFGVISLSLIDYFLIDEANTIAGKIATTGTATTGDALKKVASGKIASYKEGVSQAVNHFKTGGK